MQRGLRACWGALQHGQMATGNIWVLRPLRCSARTSSVPSAAYGLAGLLWQQAHVEALDACEIVARRPRVMHHGWCSRGQPCCTGYRWRRAATPAAWRVLAQALRALGLLSLDIFHHPCPSAARLRDLISGGEARVKWAHWVAPPGVSTACDQRRPTQVHTCALTAHLRAPLDAGRACAPLGACAMKISSVSVPCRSAARCGGCAAGHGTLERRVVDSCAMCRSAAGGGCKVASQGCSVLGSVAQHCSDG